MKRVLLYFIMCMAFVSCSDELLEESLSLMEEQEGTSFEWTRAEDKETRAQFLRNFGLGYSYNAVRGAFCDWKDIRCQILNRTYLQQYQDDTGEPVIHFDQSESSVISSHFEYSIRDYVANVTLNTKEKIDIGLYNKEKRKRQYFIENGVQEQYFYTLEEKEVMLNAYVDYANVLSSYKKNPNMLTLSFRSAVEHLRQTDVQNIAAVDSFINVYGTHVVVFVQLGGRLRVDLKNDMWRWNDQSQTDEWTTEQFLNAVSNKEEHRQEAEFQWLEHASLNIDARGGDQSTLTTLLGEHKYDGTRTFSLDGISAWRKSIFYNPDDELNSNVEMVDMKVAPIWEFAEPIDHNVALRIKAAVLQDAALQQQLLGEVNFFDTSFPIRYPETACQWRKGTNDWQPFTRKDESSALTVVNIESGGRYVATICHEVIDGKNLWVCYPIYEGKIKQACGLGVDDEGMSWRVKWLGGKATLINTGIEAEDDCFYINAGAVEVEREEDINYAEAHALPYIELAGGIRPDGTYQSKAYEVYKQGEDFFLSLTGTELPSNLVGWTFDKEKNLFKRKDNYTYIFNKNEIRYE